MTNEDQISVENELRDRTAAENYNRWVERQYGGSSDASIRLESSGAEKKVPKSSTVDSTQGDDTPYDSLLGGADAAFEAPPEPTLLEDLKAIPSQSIVGGYDAFVEQGRSARDFAEWGARYIDSDTVDKVSDWADSFPDMPTADRVGPVSTFFRSMSQFLVGLAGPAKFLKFAKWGAGVLPTAAKGVVGGGLSGATAFDPDIPNSAEVIGEFGKEYETLRKMFDAFPEPIQNFLMNLPDQPNDSALQKRWKAFQADGFMIGVPIETGMALMRIFKASRALTKMSRENMDFDVQSDVVREKIRKDAPESIMDVENTALAKKRGVIRTSRDKVAGLESKIAKDLETVKDIPDLQDTAKTLKLRPKLKKLKDKLKKQEDELAGIYREQIKHGTNPRTGLPNGATRFVDPVIGADGKVIDFESLGISWDNVGSVDELLFEIRSIVERLEREIVAGSKMGPTERKRRARDALKQFEKELEGDPIKYFNVWSGTKENRALSNLAHRPFTFKDTGDIEVSQARLQAARVARGKHNEPAEDILEEMHDLAQTHRAVTRGQHIPAEAKIHEAEMGRLRKAYDALVDPKKAKQLQKEVEDAVIALKEAEGGRSYQSVEHAYQSLKSGSFDEVAYNKKWDSGVKIRGTKGTKTKDNWNVTLMKDLMRSSFGAVDNETGKFVFNAEADWALRELKKSIGKTITHEGGKKDIWTDEFPRILSDLRDEFFGPSFLRSPEEIIVNGIGYGARTESQAMAMEVVRTAAGSKLWNLMTAAMKGDPDAIAQLPVQLARTTYIEGLIEKSSFVFDQRKSIQEITRQLEHSQLGFARNFNEEAAALMKEMRKSVPDADGVDLAIRLNALTNRGQYSNLLHQGAKPGMFQFFLEHYYNSILSAVDSILGNGFGAHAYLVYQAPTYLVAALVGGARNLQHGAPRVGEPMTQASFSALRSGIGAYVRTFVNSLEPLANNIVRTIFLKDPETTFSRQKFESFQQKAINAETARPVIGAIDKIFRYATQDTLSIREPLELMANYWGKFMRIIQNSYATADEFNKVIAADFQRHYMAQIATEAASRELEAAIKSGAIKNWSSKAMGNYYDAALKRHSSGIEDDAMELADMIAFTEPLEHAAAAKTLVDDWPALRVLFPLLRSQSSIIKSMITNSPISPFSPYFKAEVAKGGVYADIAKAKVWTGTMTAMALLDAWHGGRVTGSAPHDKNTREGMKQVGFQPNSILVSGDPWYFHLDTVMKDQRVLAGHVIEVDDADTVTVQDSNGEKHVVRFLGVDADEKDMDRGPSSTGKLKEMIMGKSVTVEWKKKGHFGRVLGTVIHDGKNINKAIIEESDGVREKLNPPRYVPFKDLGPFGPLMSTYVNTFELFQDPPIEALKDVPDDRNVILAMAEDIGSNLTNRTYFNGLFQIINGINTGGDQWLVNLNKSLIPRIVSKSADVTAGVKRDLSVFDPTITENHKLLQKMLMPWKALDPEFRKGVPKRDGHSRVGVRPPITAGSYFNIPIGMQAVRNDAVVYMHFLENQFNFPDMPQTISIPNPKGLSLRAELTVKEFARFGELMEGAQVDGKSYFSSMRDLVTSSAFLEDTNIGPKGQRYKMLKTNRDLFLLQATADLIEEFPHLLARIEENARDTLDERFVEDRPNPNLDRSTQMLLQDKLGAPIQ